MIIFLLITGLIISIGCNIALVILVKNLLLKLGVYEDWILDTQTDVINTLEQMRAIDRQGTFATSLNDKGVFESDDQVGGIFKELMALVEKLEQKIQ
jgi:hypothetical protein